MSAPAESVLREEGFAHREDGSSSLLRDGELALTTRLPSLQEEPKSGSPNGRSGTPDCSGCSALRRLSRYDRPALEPLKCGAERGAPNCSKCSPFRPFAPKPIE